MAELPPLGESFTKIQSWMKKVTPDVSFRPPANPAAIDHFAHKSSLQISQDLRQYLLIADGETRKSAGAIGNWRLMPINEIQAAWGLLASLSQKGAFSEKRLGASPYLRDAWWHPGWIPIVSSDTGHYFCLDSDPPEPQRTGQVLLYLHDRPERPLVAGSLPAWFDRIARDLVQGIYTYDIENGFNYEAFMWSSLEGKHLFDDINGKLVA